MVVATVRVSVRQDGSVNEQRGEGRDSTRRHFLTAGVRVLVVGIQALVYELGHLVHSAGLNIIHEFLQAGLRVERRQRLDYKALIQTERRYLSVCFVHLYEDVTHYFVLLHSLS